MTESVSTQTTERTFAAETFSIGEARRFVRDTTAGAIVHTGGERDVRSDVELAVSELVTNAIEYGSDGPVTVAVTVTPATVVVSVRSARTSSGIADPSTWAGPLPAVRTGRGLAIVRAVSDDVSVVADESVVTVDCTFHIG